MAISTAVDALAKLQHQETKKTLEAYAKQESVSDETVTITHSIKFVSNKDPLFWFSCYVRLFPRGDLSGAMS